MPSLENHLKTLNFSTQLEQLNCLLDAESKKPTRVSFWGTRLVRVNGYSGSVALTALAEKILNVARERCEADDLTTKERIAGIELKRKLNKFYLLTDAQIKNSNFFTRFLNFLREFTLFPYTTRFHVGELGTRYFSGYSKAKFIQQFGATSDNWREHPAYEGFFAGGYSRIVAKEEYIRKLLP